MERLSWSLLRTDVASQSEERWQPPPCLGYTVLARAPAG